MKKLLAILLLCFSASVFATPKPAYSVAEITITDKEGYQKDLWPKIQKLLTDAGAVVIVGGGQSEGIVDAPKMADRITIIKFKSYGQAKGFYASKSYQDLKPLADKYVKVKLYIVEGE